jgi:hypothetical protein
MGTESSPYGLSVSLTLTTPLAKLEKNHYLNSHPITGSN